MSSNFQQLTDGSDQNIGDIHDSIAEFFKRQDVQFEKVKRRELNLPKTAAMPAFKQKDFPCWLFKGTVDLHTGEPKVENLLIQDYPDEKHEEGYTIPGSGLRKSREERDRKLKLGYHMSPAGAQVDAEEAAIAFRTNEMENEEAAKLGAVRRVWGGNAPGMASTSQDAVIAKLMDQIEAMQRRFDSLTQPPPPPAGHMNLSRDTEPVEEPSAQIISAEQFEQEIVGKKPVPAQPKNTLAPPLSPKGGR